MTVSAGFYKKIEQWVVDSKEQKIAFQPFQANGNPYKSNTFIITATPEPFLQIDLDDLDIFAESLVSSNEFQELFSEEIKTASREYKGCLNFMEWMKTNYGENVVLSYLNCLYVEDSRQYKEMKKQNMPLYERGMAILQELLNEFSPKVVIVQGATNWKQFLELYGEQLTVVADLNQSVQQLETQGVLAKLSLENGEVVNILACRSLGNFGKTGTSFSVLKQTINDLL